MGFEEHLRAIRELQEHRESLGSSDHQFLADALQIFRGYCWTIDAIALRILEDMPELTREGALEESLLALEKYGHRISEIVGQFKAAQQLNTELLGFPHYHADGTVTVEFRQLPDTEDRIPTDLFHALQEQSALKEKLTETEIVMIAGHQGSGKDTLAEYLQKEHGFHILVLSGIVSDVASVWGLNPQGTTEKIITGQVFKEYFGADILVQLGVADSLRDGHQRIVIVGPRVPEEVIAAKQLGAKVVGVVIDRDPQQDQQLRRERVKARAEKGQRPQDVTKFDEREAMEHGRIQGILSMADVVLTNDSPQVESLFTQAVNVLKLENRT